jgi:hypothetical protein
MNKIVDKNIEWTIDYITLKKPAHILYFVFAQLLYSSANTGRMLPASAIEKT